MNKESNILKSFSVQNTLNPEIWDLTSDDIKMKPEVRKKLLEIGLEFFDFLDVEVFGKRFRI